MQTIQKKKHETIPWEFKTLYVAHFLVDSNDWQSALPKPTNRVNVPLNHQLPVFFDMF